MLRAGGTKHSGRWTLSQDFRGGEAGLNLEEGAGAGQVEKEKAVDSRPRLCKGPQATAARPHSGSSQASWAAAEGDGGVEGRTRPGELAGMNLQGFELQAAELGPCLRHWGDMKGTDVRGSPQGERKGAGLHPEGLWAPPILDSPSAPCHPLTP